MATTEQQATVTIRTSWGTMVGTPAPLTTRPDLAQTGQWWCAVEGCNSYGRAPAWPVYVWSEQDTGDSYTICPQCAGY